MSQETDKRYEVDFLEERARDLFIEQYGEDPEDVLGPNWLATIRRINNKI